ncbi:MAG: hypothetical protein KC486_27585, partial [Myxococcales bacterium]|nr:hypothetical protein [Myxococcales bacterium]
EDEYDRELDEILAGGDLSAMPSLGLGADVDDELLMDVEAAMATSRAHQVEVEAGGAIVEEVDEPWPESASEGEENEDDTGIIIEMLDDDEAWPDDPWGRGVGGGPSLISTDTGTSDEYIDIDLFDDSLDSDSPSTTDEALESESESESELELEPEPEFAEEIEIVVDVVDSPAEASAEAPTSSAPTASEPEATGGEGSVEESVELGAAALRALGGPASRTPVLDLGGEVEDDADSDFEDVFADMEMPLLIAPSAERPAVEVPSAARPASDAVEDVAAVEVATAGREESSVAVEVEEPRAGVEVEAGVEVGAADDSAAAPEVAAPAVEEAEAAPVAEEIIDEVDAVDAVEEVEEVEEIDAIAEAETPTPTGPRDVAAERTARWVKPVGSRPAATPKPPTPPKPRRPLPRLKLPPLGRREPEPEVEAEEPVVAAAAEEFAAPAPAPEPEPAAEQVIEIDVEATAAPAPALALAPTPAPPAAQEVEVDLDGLEEVEIDMTIEEPAAPADELIIDIDFGDPIDDVEVEVGPAAAAEEPALASGEAEVELDPASASGVYIASPLELELPADDDDEEELLAPPMRDLSPPRGREDAPPVDAPPAGAQPSTVGIPLDDDDDD